MSFDKHDLRRETFLDIQSVDCFKLYKTHQQSFWTSEEIDLSTDRESFLQLSEEEKKFVKKISTFFLISDAVVADNVDIISNHLNLREIKAFYAIQSAMENTHIETYGNIFEIVFDKNDSESIIKEILSMPSVIKKRDFCSKISKENLAKLVLANTFVEGIFFSTSFSGILWLKKRGKCPGIVKANEWIARDERLHWRFGCEIFKRFCSLPKEEVYDVINQIAEIEKEFINDILETDMGDMNRISLDKYVEFCCNEILDYMGIEPYFKNISQPFEFMKFLNYPLKANFFETRVTNYSLPSDKGGFSYDGEKKYVYNPLN